ncbi:MAG: thrombospondin type 3 repeat-containing protein [Patescibacteria group bacterium]|nr:thrombospondin type 3 repeat-containing protein [Patescibacteria group bacterium]
MRTSSRIITIAVLILVALVLAGAIVLVAYQGKTAPLLNRVITLPFLEDEPEVVVMSMQRAMTQLKTAYYEFEINSTPSSSAQSFGFEATVQFDGGFVDGIVGELVANGGISLAGFDYLFSGLAHSGSDKFYFQFQELPAIPYLTLAPLQGTWYERSALMSSVAQKENFKKSRTLLGNTHIFTSIERLPDDVQAGEKLYHYRTSIDTEALKSLFHDNSINQKNSSDSIQGATAELWIGKQDSYMYRADLAVTTKKELIVVHLVANDFGKTVKIELPGDAKPAHDFIETLFGQTLILDAPALLQKTGLFSPTDLEDDDSDGLSAVWENFFGTNQSRSDTDNDGYSDSEEVRSGHNPLGTGKLFSDS